MTFKLTYLAAILAVTLDLFIWRPDLEPNQLRPEHPRGYGELKALAIQRSDDASSQRPKTCRCVLTNLQPQPQVPRPNPALARTL